MNTVKDALPTQVSTNHWYFLVRDLAGVVAVFVVFVALPALLSSFGGARWDSIGTMAAIWAIAALGMDVVWGLAGHVSLGQHGIVALGAYMTAVSTTSWGWRPEFGLILGVVVAAIIGIIVGAIVLRLDEAYMALATLGIGLLIPSLFNAWTWTGAAVGIYGVPDLSLFGFTFDTDDLYWVTWLTAALIALALMKTRSSRPGLAWRTVAVNDLLAESCGIATYRRKNQALVLSAVIGAIAGSLYAHFASAISPATFSTFMLVILMTTVVVGGLGSVVGIGLGAIVLSYIVSYSAQTNDLTEAIFGVTLIGTLLVARRGIVGLLRTLYPKSLRQRIQPTGPLEDDAGAPQGILSVREVRPRSSLVADGDLVPEVILEVSDVAKSFGGVTVLQSVSLSIRGGEVYGLVGPNGAGKSTLLNIISGFLPADDGGVTWLGTDITTWPAWRRSRAGLGRTFQHPIIVPGLSVLENIALGSLYREGRFTGPSVPEAIEEAADLGGWLGLGSVLNNDAESLSFSQQRIAEIARSLVAKPFLICLDEATSGLDVHERREVREALALIPERGIALCIVEHDMEFIAGACDQVTVIDNGVVIAQTTGATVFKDRSVIQSYTGR